MIRFFPGILLSIMLLQLSLAVNAQKLLQDYDSLPLAKPKPLKPTFVFPPPGIGTATLVYSTPFSTELQPKKGKFDGLWTGLTGLGTQSSSSSNYLGTHEINLSDASKSWRVHLYCYGTSTTERQRVKGDDGMYSVNKTETLYLDWSNGAQGFLLEQSDTVGVFVLIIDPAVDKQVSPWLTTLKQQHKIPAIVARTPYSYPSLPDYAVYGKLHDKFFYIVTSGDRWVSLILFDDKPVGVFRSDFNHWLNTTKKWRFEPYMLVDKSLNERGTEDVEKLAMVAWLVTKGVGSR